MTYDFQACRVSGDGNAVFPDELIIDEEEKVVIYRKPKLIGCKETTIRFGAIASVLIDKHILFADVIIETHGGRQLILHGFTHDDAEWISRLLSV